MTTTNQAFIRAYRGEPASDAQRCYAAATMSPIAGERSVARPVHIELGTSVQLIGAETQAAEPFTQPADMPPQPVFPSALRQQQQYFRLDRPNFDADSHHSRWSAPDGPGPTWFAGRQDEVRPATVHSPAVAPALSQQPVTLTAFRYPASCEQLYEQYGFAFEAVLELIAELIDEGRTLIGVAGSRPQVGCTTTALCLARCLLSQGRSVALVDANLSRPTLASTLGIQPSYTWQDVLGQGVPLAAALVRSASDGLTVLPSAPSYASASQPSHGMQPSVTAGALRYAYDVTLVDLGAAQQTHATATVEHVAQAMRIDGLLLVTNDQPGLDADRFRVEQRLRDSRCPILGVIENFSAANE